MLFNIKDIEYSINNNVIINRQSLKINEGQHLLLLGPSGCGKTTLLNIMSGLLKPDSGELSYRGDIYSSFSDNKLDRLRAKNFGFIFQKIHLIRHLTVAQNIAISQMKPNPTKVQELVNDLGLNGKENQKAKDLSVGEAQRVAIARAVANNPKVIFADEPSSALDDANTEKVINLIFSQAKKTNATVIASTHDARIKAHFKTILELA